VASEFLSVGASSSGSEEEESHANISLDQYTFLGARADAIRAQIMTFMEEWQILLLPVASIPAFVPGPLDFTVSGFRVARFNIELGEFEPRCTITRCY